MGLLLLSTQTPLMEGVSSHLLHAKSTILPGKEQVFPLSRSAEVRAKLKVCGKKWLPCLCGSRLLFHVRPLTEAVGLTDKLKNMAFACQPIQEGCRHNLIPKNAVPVSKAQISGDNDGNPFMEIRAQLKQHLPAVFGKRKEA